MRSYHIGIFLSDLLNVQAILDDVHVQNIGHLLAIPVNKCLSRDFILAG